MDTLERLLEENYNNRFPSQECTEEVIAFLRNNSSIADKPIIFIKQFTKVAYNIWDNDPESLQWATDRLYQFHEEGISNIIQGKSPNISHEQATNIKAHLSGYKGHLAKTLFEQTKDPTFAEKAYESYFNAGTWSLDAATLTCERESGQKMNYRGYSGSQFFRAANIAKELFRITNNTKWKRKEYDCLLKSAENQLPHQIGTSLKDLLQAAELAYELRQKKGDWPQLGIDAYRQYVKCAQENGVNTNSPQFKKIKQAIFELKRYL